MTQANNNSKRPTHYAYQVKEGKDNQSHWQKIGAVWPHKDGNGFRVQLDSFPVNGLIEVRPVKTKES